MRNVTFVVNVYADEHLAHRLFQQLWRHYEGAKVIIVHDSPRLKTRQTGEWSQRYLEQALATDADVIIKCDPDACAWRPAIIPDLDWFGTLPPSRRFVRGGVCGFSRKAAAHLVSSGLLLLPSEHTYQRYGYFRWPHEKPDPRPISCQDKIVGDAMIQLGYEPQEWDEVLILGNAMRSPVVGSQAFTHPHPYNTFEHG